MKRRPALAGSRNNKVQRSAETPLRGLPIHRTTPAARSRSASRRTRGLSAWLWLGKASNPTSATGADLN
jgi:hypothetical protein